MEPSCNTHSPVRAPLPGPRSVLFLRVAALRLCAARGAVQSARARHQEVDGARERGEGRKSIVICYMACLPPLSRYEFVGSRWGDRIRVRTIASTG